MHSRKQNRGGIVVPNSFISEEASIDALLSRGQTTTPFRPIRLCGVKSSRRRRCKKRIPWCIHHKKVASKRIYRTTDVILRPRGMRSYHRRLVRPTPRWKVKILPVQKVPSWPENVDNLPNLAVDGDAAIPDEKENRKDGAPLIRSFSILPSKSKKPPPNVDFIEPKVIQLINHVRTTQSPFRKSLNAMRPEWKSNGNPGAPQFQVRPNQSATPPPPPSSQAYLRTPSPVLPNRNLPQPTFTQGTCGVPPEFKPCVSSERASLALLECCRRKNLPAGCLSLCRYDITQAEVRSAMDRGLCGIFSVAPFLECASQGKDNTDCCRYKGIPEKTGPQCEQFCRPSKGLTPLGLQHIVCGNVIGEMLQCHHSGIRR